MLSQSRLLELLDVDLSTGEMRWRVDKGKARVGQLAGRKTAEDRRQVMIDGKLYQHTHLIFLARHGHLPSTGLIDHRDRDIAANAASNLRAATPAQNAWNRSVRRDSSTGVKGVMATKYGFRVRVMRAGKRIEVGTFASLSEAEAARIATAKDLHGDFAC